MRDLVNSEEQVVVCRSTDSISTQEECWREDASVAQRVGHAELEQHDTEHYPLRQRFMTH